jgi:hypothetical protein
MKHKGQTYTLVLQPWLESGYFLNLGNSPISLESHWVLEGNKYNNRWKGRGTGLDT